MEFQLTSYVLWKDEALHCNKQKPKHSLVNKNLWRSKGFSANFLSKKTTPSWRKFKMTGIIGRLFQEKKPKQYSKLFRINLSRNQFSAVKFLKDSWNQGQRGKAYPRSKSLFWDSLGFATKLNIESPIQEEKPPCLKNLLFDPMRPIGNSKDLLN